ncbi:Hypothetical predicted protein [Mytilus galloprovincialis]|uniref:Apple domain-containing protein n=1 Tax=Mytilus galloprovincialis TaxID=29158 RepID=A0A8B6G1R5_MYTGA|nr:Hypothetical predicted protein [Mytilus galloprovincialis]
MKWIVFMCILIFPVKSANAFVSKLVKITGPERRLLCGESKNYIVENKMKCVIQCSYNIESCRNLSFNWQTGMCTLLNNCSPASTYDDADGGGYGYKFIGVSVFKF